MDSQIISLNEELQDMREKYNELRNGNASKNQLNDDTPMCERHEANYIQSEEDFKRRIRSMRTVYWKLYDRDDGKTTGVLPNKESKTINQEPQAKTDFEKSITKFLDGQRVTNMFFKNNVNDMILKMKQNEKNFQTKIKNMERKIDEWSKSQNVSSEQTDRTEPQPPPQAHTDQVNVIFIGSEKSVDPLKTQKDSPSPIIIPRDLHPRLPSEEFVMSELLDDAIGIYHRMFDFSGVRIPFPSFLLALIKHYRVYFSQLGPLGLNKAILDSMVWRHPSAAIDDLRPAACPFSMADVRQVSAHVIKLRDMHEGVLVWVELCLEEPCL
ncbi:hypothetical protein Tco_0232852 [Tanacetum coccineum]